MSAKKHLHQGAPISKARRQFDELAKSMQSIGSAARAWRAVDEETSELVRRELSPLQQAYDQRLRQLVLMLDGLHADPALDEDERVILSGYLADTILDLPDDEDLDRIFERHDMAAGDEDEDGDEAAELAYQAEFKQVLSELYGGEIEEDVDLRSPEGLDMVRYLIEEDEELQAARQRRNEARLEQVETQARQHEAELATAIDAIVRELDGAARDAGARADEGWQAFMRRAETAAAEQNLTALLAIRLELEQRGLAGHVPEKQLASCNKLIKEELRIARREIAYFESELADRLGMKVVEPLTPELQLRELRTDIVEARDMLAEVERHLDELRDACKLKAWLRQIDEDNRF